MSGTDATANKLELLSSDDVSRTVARIAHQIIEKTALDSADAPRVILLGIPSGGVPLAQRLAHKIEEFSGVAVPWGSLDITLYRDDLLGKPHRALQPTTIPPVASITPPSFWSTMCCIPAALSAPPWMR